MNFLNMMASAPATQGGAEHQARLDAQARRAGYRNYEEMRAFLLARQRPNENANIDGGDKTRQPSAPATPHPTSIFNYITEVLRNAVGGGN